MDENEKILRQRYPELMEKPGSAGVPPASAPQAPRLPHSHCSLCGVATTPLPPGSTGICLLCVEKYGTNYCEGVLAGMALAGTRIAAFERHAAQLSEALAQERRVKDVGWKLLVEERDRARLWKATAICFPFVVWAVMTVLDWLARG